MFACYRSIVYFNDVVIQEQPLRISTRSFQINKILSEWHGQNLSNSFCMNFTYRGNIERS